jgi:hypothetical protein
VSGGTRRVPKPWPSFLGWPFFVRPGTTRTGRPFACEQYLQRDLQRLKSPNRAPAPGNLAPGHRSAVARSDGRFSSETTWRPSRGLVQPAGRKRWPSPRDRPPPNADGQPTGRFLGEQLGNRRRVGLIVPRAVLVSLHPFDRLPLARIGRGPAPISPVVIVLGRQCRTPNGGLLVPKPVRPSDSRWVVARSRGNTARRRRRTRGATCHIARRRRPS